MMAISSAVSLYPTECSALIEALLAGVHDALGDNLLGFYLRGSLALGDFNTETSDVDVLVVSERPISEAEFEALATLHARIPAGDNQYGRRYELSYIDRASIKRFARTERRHPKIADDSMFGWSEHRANWILERWTVRERGLTLLGPDPKTLIDPISPEEIRRAVTEELQERVEHWTDGTWRQEELLHRGAQVFEIETVCRALCTIASTTLPTKPQATAWALNTLPEPWHSLVEWSQKHRGEMTRDATKIPEVMRFLRWAASHSQAVWNQHQGG